MTSLHSTYRISPARPEDTAECLRLRGLTRENAFSPAELQAQGITEASWRAGIESEELIGLIAWAGTRMAGYCFADRSTGEIMVLALLPEDEGHGLGRLLLSQVVEALRHLGRQTLFLSCSSDP
ncbi:GNAT family N-acetyltransferase, partial [Kerstersia gyiorum]